MVNLSMKRIKYQIYYIFHVFYLFICLIIFIQVIIPNIKYDILLNSFIHSISISISYFVFIDNNIIHNQFHYNMNYIYQFLNFISFIILVIFIFIIQQDVCYCYYFGRVLILDLLGMCIIFIIIMMAWNLVLILLDLP